jgi:hypothetical protein
MRIRRAGIVGLLWLAAQGLAPVTASAQSAATKPAALPRSPGADEAALAAFRAAVNGYLEIRKKIAVELPPMRVTSNAAEITAASDALARAVQRARPRARQGSFFTPEVGAVIRRELELALRSTDRASVLALINEEQTSVRRPTIHMRFPQADVLATMPAVLLNALPPLPPELEYRFIGRALIVRDVQAALILDYLSPALPTSESGARAQDPGSLGPDPWGLIRDA